MYYALSFILGLILGLALKGFGKKKGTAIGKFVINSSDPEKDIFTIDLENVDAIYAADVVTMEVVRDYEVKRK